MTFRNSRHSSRLVSIAVLAFLGILIGVLLYGMNTGGLKSFFQSVHHLGWIGVIIGIAIQTLINIVPLPGEFTSVLLMELYGPVWGGIYSWAGGLLGAIGAFYAIRTMSAPFTANLKSNSVYIHIELLVKRPTSSLLLIRLVPFLPYHIVNYALGLLDVKLGRYIWTSAVGIIPFHVAMSIIYVGVKKGYIIWGVVVVSLFVLLGLGGWLLKRRHESSRVKSPY